MSQTKLQDSQIPTKRYQLSPGGDRLVEKSRSTELFLKGPIPLVWLSRAALLPGKTLNVALAICWLSGMSKNRAVKVTRQALQHFHVSRDAYLDALKRMEEVGLITVQRSSGRTAIVEILNIKTET